MADSPHIRILRKTSERPFGLVVSNDVISILPLLDSINHLENYPTEWWQGLRGSSTKPFDDIVDLAMNCNFDLVTETLDHNNIPGGIRRELRSPSFCIDGNNYHFLITKLFRDGKTTQIRRELSIIADSDFVKERPDSGQILSLLSDSKYGQGLIFSQSIPGERSPLWWQLQQVWLLLQQWRGKVKFC